LKKRLIELINKSEYLKFLIGFSIFGNSGIISGIEGESQCADESPRRPYVENRLTVFWNTVIRKRDYRTRNVATGFSIRQEILEHGVFDKRDIYEQVDTFWN
jgi:hypothetical protein